MEEENELNGYPCCRSMVRSNGTVSLRTEGCDLSFAVEGLKAVAPRCKVFEFYGEVVVMCDGDPMRRRRKVQLSNQKRWFLKELHVPSQ